jgi:hypothetical protein
MFDHVLINLVGKTLGICTDPLVSPNLSSNFSGHRWGGYRVTVDIQGMRVTKHLQTQHGELNLSRERGRSDLPLPHARSMTVVRFLRTVRCTGTIPQWKI